MNTGWICPRCSKVHAPSVLACECAPVQGTTHARGCGCWVGICMNLTRCPHVSYTGGNPIIAGVGGTGGAGK